ncbi:uracil-DNA glycosylase, partial [Aureobasidium melanogenum]
MSTAGASRHTPLSTVKAVILGQDPYHNLNQAHGLCFSVRPPTPAPPSLQNIYKALKKEYPSFEPPPNKGGLLTPWADRGVLLLNTCLTVRAHEANSHAGKGWEKFTQKVIDIVCQKQTLCGPLSAHKGFFDCGHFTKANEWLKERYGDDGVIDWNLNVAPEDAGV